MKWFISLPMHGKSEADIRREMNNKFALIQEIDPDAILLDTIFTGVDKGPLHYLGRAIQVMDNADRVFMCKGWANARGCSIEHECALTYNKQIVYERTS